MCQRSRLNAGNPLPARHLEAKRRRYKGYPDLTLITMRPYYLLSIAERRTIAERRNNAASMNDEAAFQFVTEVTRQLAAASVRETLAELVDDTDNLRTLGIPAPYDEIVVELVNYHRSRGSLAPEFITGDDYKGLPGEHVVMLAEWAEYNPAKLYNFLLKLAAGVAA